MPGTSKLYQKILHQLEPTKHSPSVRKAVARTEVKPAKVEKHHGASSAHHKSLPAKYKSQHSPKGMQRLFKSAHPHPAKAGKSHHHPKKGRLIQETSPKRALAHKKMEWAKWARDMRRSHVSATPAQKAVIRQLIQQGRVALSRASKKPSDAPRLHKPAPHRKPHRPVKKKELKLAKRAEALNVQKAAKMTENLPALPKEETKLALEESREQYLAEPQAKSFQEFLSLGIVRGIQGFFNLI